MSTEDGPEQRDEGSVVRSDEVLAVGTAEAAQGKVRLRKTSDPYDVEQEFVREIEHADVQRSSVEGPDSGEIESLPDGSISIPVFEEELVVTKRLVVRERIIVTKEIVTETQTVRDTLQREHVDLIADANIEIEGQ